MQPLETRSYGYNKIIKEYADFPGFLPLPAHFEHGWTALPDALRSDLEVEKPLMLVFNRRRERAWKEKSKTPVAIMGAPFIHYKNARKISQNPNARGTVVFPSHSTYDLKAQFDIEEFCRSLKNLPKKFQPITINLFYLDYIDKKADIYRKHGFKITTAGCRLTNSLDFVKNFYEILSSHKFASANEVGSGALYAVDLGLPFFLTGGVPLVVNQGLKDVNIGAAASLRDYPMGKKAMDLFATGPIAEISPAQKKFVRDELGIDDCLSGNELGKVLLSYVKRRRFWFMDCVPYLFSSLWTNFLFNSPWTETLIAMRHKISVK